jgi:hypothetical protein
MGRKRRSLDPPVSDFVTGRVTGCDGFCYGSGFCKSFSINKCYGVTGLDHQDYMERPESDLIGLNLNAFREFMVIGL